MAHKGLSDLPGGIIIVEHKGKERLTMSDENDLFMTDEEMDYEDMQRNAKHDWSYNAFGDGDDHGWTQDEIDQYEDWLMSDDPGIREDGSYYD